MSPFISRRLLLGTALSAAAIGVSQHASAQSRTGGSPNTMHSSLGLKSYDPAAYFTDGKATPGSKKITLQRGELTWRFATEAHRAAFEKEPARYAPQYGGFCAWGVAQGRLFDVDPVNGWIVADNKLYVTFNGDILKLFKADQTSWIAKAEQNWPKLNQ
jgi:hypothetical protein